MLITSGKLAATIPAAKIRESITLGFVQVVLRDVEVIRSWEKDNKTYGILTADFIGKVENKKIIHNDNKIIHNDDKIIHNDDEGGNNHIVPPHNGGNGDNGNNPPFRRRGCLPGTSIFSSFSNGGCLHRIWEILKWILLFALILWLLDQCQGCNTGNRTENNCCDENEKLKEQVDSLKRRSEKLAREKKELEDDTENVKREKENSDAKVDSLAEENRVLKQKKKFGDFNEELYFFGDSDELRE